MSITYGSVCSGIEAASIAWEVLGWRPSWFSQFDPEHNYKNGPDFPSAVLAYRWPHVKNLGDMTKIAAAIRRGEIQAPDVLVGGTPCQAFSIAGLRIGLTDSRGQLTLAFVELVNAIDEKRREQRKPPVIVVWENVPGVFSSRDNAFGCFLAGLAGESCELESPGKKWTNAGYVLGPKRSVCWRVLDAQFFGVAQRRRRVFVVASARTDIDPAKILFESEGQRRDIAPRRKAGKGITANTGRRIANGSHWDGEYNPHPTLNQSHNIGGIGQSNQELFSQRGGGIVGVFRMRAFGDYVNDETASTVKARDHKDATDLTVTYSEVSRTLLAKSNDSMAENLDTYAIHGTQDPDTNINFAHTLGRNHGQENAVAYAFKAGQGAKAGGIGWAEEQSPTLTAASSGPNLSPSVMKNMAVRRLTPVECERLQGFPDNHTLIPRDKRKQITADEYAYVRHHNPKITAEEAYRLAKDGPRYKAIGNSMAVPVMRWIGKRIKEALDA
ncbi:DNA cytosine methyltransferase [Citrobacter freundii]|nr:DNA cytosine methyltransferase [Citrobacter freundii]ELK6557570.1 DNA cytosine methyltransferase [Citrobacter freundii]MBJ8770940.1 DNA cytosine methyltransferase [Citrobacter freundii]